MNRIVSHTAKRASRHTIGDILRRSRLREPNKLAFKWKEFEISYAELDDKVNQLANGLLAEGIGKGDSVALLSKNCLDYVLLFYAVARSGAVLVPINFMLQADDIRFILTHSNATTFFTSPEFLQTANLASDGLQRVKLRGLINTTQSQENWRALPEWMQGQSTMEPEMEIEEEDILNILYTSGTESRPKGVMLSHKSLISQYVSCIVDLNQSKEDIAIHALPLFHCAQLHVMLGPYVYLGASSIILETPSPAAILQTIESVKATQLFCPPTVWISLLQSPDFDQYNLSSLRKCVYGASIMPVEVLKELSRRLPQARFWNAYGQTEVAPLAVVLQPEDQQRKAGSAGRPCINVETRIILEDGTDAPPGWTGEIVHRTPHLMSGYYEDIERTNQAFTEGWFHSGDLGIMDEEGYITVIDRKKDMIKSGGENVASREVEEVIYQYPAIAEVAVFGVPHPYWIEAVTAVVVPKSGMDLNVSDLRAFCRNKLASFKVPKYILRADSIPKNPSGKILKRMLRDQYKMLAFSEREEER